MKISTGRHYKKNHTEILELENTIAGFKNSLVGFKNRLD